MPRRGPAKTEPEIPPGFVQGARSNLANWHTKQLVLNLAGNVRCFLGYRRDEQPFDLPYYGVSVAARDPDGVSSCRFIELAHGTLQTTWFLRDEDYYRVIDDRWLILPSGTDSYFGVVSKNDRSEDEALRISSVLSRPRSRRALHSD